jgi:hypothetical protein
LILHDGMIGWDGLESELYLVFEVFTVYVESYGAPAFPCSFGVCMFLRVCTEPQVLTVKILHLVLSHVLVVLAMMEVSGCV